MKIMVLFAFLLFLVGCGADAQKKINDALASPAGQLFCAVQTGGGGTIVVGLINAEITGASPAAAPVAILATGATKQFVDGACASAAAQIPGARVGIPVSPPADPVAAPKIAILKSII